MYTVATTNLMADDDVFTKGSLELMAKNTKTIDVHHEFNQDRKIGVANNFKVEDEKLICDIKLTEDRIGYFAPGIRVNDRSFEEIDDKTIRIIKDCDLISIGYTMNPSDKTLENK